ncbi:uncharacterized protein FIBRA_01753 [Fibroporia radiculosa]|uniref:BZIP domain-containing protein n=1 Tax=Fibroporia radiculosa TaxID=599839 RepID=J4I8N7_9APHY|nr:uncharacterized protein FIBRA_01753 [Fibroporia radiculosa]CCL99731.1 predicted protein [Fibroporia radiculosa]
MFASFALHEQANAVPSVQESQSASPNWFPRTDVGTSRQTAPHPRCNIAFTATESPADVYRPDGTFENTALISDPSSSRAHSRLINSPASPLSPNPGPSSTLFSRQYTPQLHRRENVRPFVVSVSSHDPPGSSTVNHGYPRISTLESGILSSFSPSQDGSISSPSHRLRTPHPVFQSTSDLAAHHGIPQFLPPVPRTTRYPSVPSTASRTEPVPASSSTNNFDFDTLCSSYLTMLSQKSEERGSAAHSADVSSEAPNNGAAVQALMEVLQASPEFQMASDFNDYLTSPMEDSPWDDLLTTPAIGSTDVASDFLTSPAIVDGDDFDYGGAPLFADSLGLTNAAYDSHKSVDRSIHAVPAPGFDNMYTMPSPSTPALDPASLHPSPRAPSIPPPATSSSTSRRRNTPTGTRKNVSPESLVSVDAPIQPRKYLTPSTTSRKDIPAVFARKRARSQAFGDDDDLDTADLPQSDLDAIEAKRRQNTLAARRSRKRKLEYQRELEVTVEQERANSERLRAQVAMMEAVLRSHGLEVPVYNPS